MGTDAESVPGARIGAADGTEGVVDVCLAVLDTADSDSPAADATTGPASPDDALLPVAVVPAELTAALVCTGGVAVVVTTAEVLTIAAALAVDVRGAVLDVVGESAAARADSTAAALAPAFADHCVQLCNPTV